jgi:O-methyltransferase
MWSPSTLTLRTTRELLMELVAHPVSPRSASTDYEAAPRQGFRWLRWLLPRRLQPLARGLRKSLSMSRFSLEEPFRSAYCFTQVHPVRQANLLRLARLVEQEGVPGAVVECGVLDGGTAAIMAYGTAASGRPVHLFDSWEGLPETSPADGEAGKEWIGEVVGSPRRVVRIFKKLGVNMDRVTFHAGWFDRTFPVAQIDTIALLHLDADFYESTRLSLETWYPRLSPGGWVQIDDYAAFEGCRRAVDEFLAQHPETQLLEAGEHAKAYFFQKPRY